MKRLIILLAAIASAVPAPALATETSDTGNAPTARLALEQWAGCIARTSAGEAGRVLQMDFTSTKYQRAMEMLQNKNSDCIRFRGTMRTSRLLLAGEIAESLLEAGATPLPVVLARAATAPQTTAFSFTDRVAICAVRSAPAEVAALFATARDTPAEEAAVSAVSVAMGMCAKAASARNQLSINPAGMRAMLATAAFRQVSAAAAGRRP